jgi:hypothetical protein
MRETARNASATHQSSVFIRGSKGCIGVKGVEGVLAITFGPDSGQMFFG